MINRFFQYSAKCIIASSLIFSTGAAVGIAHISASEDDGSKVIEDGGGGGGVTWQESYRFVSGSYKIIVYRSANGGSQWKEVTYNNSGAIVKVEYGTS
ncbi:hypothetical protein FGG79_03595 [Bacillus sp. BHET2]|uniref:hypothetical protein n=1 Tax=Bacillus sp. BHET2 TaxID=2583818 RepID=UPI00110E0B16|nr:hypothetical protein [Bacillus sp. BHET2]TMU87231.1 hypothetical protein FGG79_03595 [Bacillus sp. BHET2]